MGCGVVDDEAVDGEGADTDARAARWVVRIHGDPLTPDEQAAFERWLAAGPHHRAAFDAAQSAWLELDRLRLMPGALAEAPEMPVLAESMWHRWVPRGAIALGGSAILSLGLLWFGDPLTMLRADHRTGVGEVRTVLLEDGSRVALAPASAISVDFDENGRRITLLSGAASFEAVSREAAGGRAFVVAADKGEARALGTRYVVERLPDAVRVTVAEHDVEVSVPASEGGASRSVITPGHQVRYDAAGLGAVTTANPAQVEAWRRGRLLFDGAPLAEVVATLNRYRRGRIVIASDTLAQRRVSGMFDATDVDAALTAIVDELGAGTISIGPFLTVIR